MKYFKVPYIIVAYMKMLKIYIFEDMVAFAFNYSTKEGEAGGSL